VQKELSLDEFFFRSAAKVLLTSGIWSCKIDEGSAYSTAGLARRYAVKVSEENRETLRTRVGLCADCRFMRRIESDRGSTFYLCERFVTDARFPKYPRLPVLQCAGYERLSADGECSEE
jgi:hypothetical protein